MTKETILFVHGAWHGKWCWDQHYRSIFEQAGYHVVTFDLPGHDRPGKIKGINRYSIRNYVDALITEVQKLDEPPILIGHSMGGLIIQKYLEHHTCKKAVLMASAPPFGVINATLKFLRKAYTYPALLTFDLYGLVNSANKSRFAFFSNTLPDSSVRAYTNQLCSELKHS